MISKIPFFHVRALDSLYVDSLGVVGIPSGVAARASSRHACRNLKPSSPSRPGHRGTRLGLQPAIWAGLFLMKYHTILGSTGGFSNEKYDFRKHRLFLL